MEHRLYPRRRVRVGQGILAPDGLPQEPEGRLKLSGWQMELSLLQSIPAMSRISTASCLQIHFKWEDSASTLDAAPESSSLRFPIACSSLSN